MKIIELTQGYEALVDDYVYALLGQYLWYALPYTSKGSTVVYAYRVVPYNVGHRKQRRVRMHREILGIDSPGFKDRRIIDHIDGNGLNNQRDNLRIVSHSINNQNVRSKKLSDSGYRGVYGRGWDAWKAEISIKGKSIYLGYFKDPILAAQAYDKKAIELHGKHATTNFPQI